MLVRSTCLMSFTFLSTKKELAKGVADCVKADLATVPVAEYLEDVGKNCMGEDVRTFSANVTTGNCRCCRTLTRCVSPRFKILFTDFHAKRVSSEPWECDVGPTATYKVVVWQGRIVQKVTNN